jgi:hypothetical protein
MPSKGETTFKASKETKNHDHVPNKNQSNISDEEEAKFIRKLKKGSRKYKGKLPLKCFNYGKIGILPPNVPIPSIRIVMMKKIIAIKNLKRKIKKLETRRNYTRKIKTYTCFSKKGTSERNQPIKI